MKNDKLSLLVLLIAVFFILNFTPLAFSTERGMMGEICDNGIDDDNDGLIDFNDPDCECEFIELTSLIPNPSFEDMECCPYRRSQLNCTSVWIQASEATTDYIHTCDWLGWPEFPPPRPFPDGEGILGFRDGRFRPGSSSQGEKNWKEYAGACLLDSLKAGNCYRFEFDVGFVDYLSSPPVNISFFGTTNCKNLPFGVGDEAFGCPTNGPGWVKLGSTFLSGGAGNKWIKGSIEVTPKENINAIAIGPDCPPVESEVNIYYYFDNLLLADCRSFELRISEVSHPCSKDFSLKILEDSNFSYQWYKDGIALIGETSSQLKKMYGEGDYQVRINDRTLCRLSEAYIYRIPVFEEQVNIAICEDRTYPFGKRLLSETGFYVDTFKTEENCDKIVSLNLKVLGTSADTVRGKIFKGESYKIDRYSFEKEGEYIITLASSQGCDSLVLLKLEHFNIFIPNVFSPNQDGLNDVFSILEGEELIQSSELAIFDRWGALVYKGSEWDGKDKSGSPVSPGVFLYLAKLKMNDGVERQLAGSLTVLR